MSKSSPMGVCQISQQSHPIEDMIRLDTIRPKLLKFIQLKYPNISPDGYLCQSELNKFRLEYVKLLLEAEMGELTVLEEDVVKSIKEHELVTSNPNAEFDESKTFGERCSDWIAEFGGSWKFIIIFFIFLLVWVIANSVMLVAHPLDPYPFIFLNLMLSCLAAIQAPIIMMSQNRLEAKDRLRAENDYKINLKAELEIRHLHEKVDHMLKQFSQRLFEVQQIQLELMQEQAEKKKR